ncbi:MAG: 6-phosphogluconolactonase [Desulfobacterales bacterium]
MTSPVDYRIIVAQSPERLARQGAELFQSAAVDSVARSGFFTVALSGGGTPRPMHRLLATEPYRSGIPWRHTHLFWVDERLVPVADPASNFGHAEKDFLRHLPVPEGHIHHMVSHKTPAAAAEAYEQELRRYFTSIGSPAPLFDLIVLGVGEDGHTASIFPGDARAVATVRWVAAVKGGAPDVDRLTLTLPVINQARRIVFLVSGSKKASVIRLLLADASDRLPARHIHSHNGKVIWLLDEAAAALLPPDLPGCDRPD